MKYRTDSYEKLQMKEKNGKVSSKLVVSTIYNMNYWGKGIYLKHYFFLKECIKITTGKTPFSKTLVIKNGYFLLLATPLVLTSPQRKLYSGLLINMHL